MKVCVIQPYYSMDPGDADACFDALCGLLDRCDDSLDLIVLPEYCDVPINVPDAAAMRDCIRKYRPVIEAKSRELAKRCRAVVCANYACDSELGFRNTTHVFDRNGEEVGRYDKAHPAPSEEKTPEQGGKGVDCSYSYRYAKPYTVTVDGIKYGFLTCYDFYMYEAFPQLADEDVDIIIGCSHQRTDTHAALDIIGQFLTYNTNAYLVRSSVSLGEDSEVCGSSMVVSPDGTILLEMKNEIGLGITEIDPAAKYYKPAGFKGAMRSHHAYIDEGRRPWLYRPAGSMMIPDDTRLPYPRICAHRGFNTIAPENSMPAFGAAVALGADEIEFDLWTTKDGVLVSSHDRTLDRVSDGTGNIGDYTYDELTRLDFGIRRGEAFRGLRIVRFEEILQKFACTVIMNIHVKIWDNPDTDHKYEEIASLLRQYHCEKHCYIMSRSDTSQAEFHQIAPEIRRCIGWNGDQENMRSMVDRALAVGAEKLQLFKPHFTQETVDYAHENGILCNVFYADDPEEAVRYREMGIDCILTNDYLQIANALRAHEAKEK